MERTDTLAVTVAVTYYNSSVVILRKCIESILEQSFRDLELLVLVDGTPLDISAVIADYEKKDERVRFIISEDNHGASYQRNRAIEEAKGRYLMFVDGDDFIDPAMLDTLYRYMDTCDISMCATDNRVFNMRRDLVDHRVFFSLPQLFLKVQYVNFSVNKLYKMSILKEHNIRYDENVVLGEDALFLSKYFKHCKYIGCESHKFYHYLMNTVSATYSYRPEYWDWEKRVIDTQWEMFHTYPLSTDQENYAAYWLYEKLVSVIEYYSNRAAGEEGDRRINEVLSEMASFPLYKELCSRTVKKDIVWDAGDIKRYNKLKKSPQAYRNHLKRTAALRTFNTIWNSGRKADKDD